MNQYLSIFIALTVVVFSHETVAAGPNPNPLFVISTNLNVGDGGGGGPESVIAADINGDGKLDLICTDTGTTNLTILTNDGHGGFIAASTNAVGDTPDSVIAVDVNGDGFLDLIAANSHSSSLTILTNDGSGVFVFQTNLPAGFKTFDVVAADVNGDGFVDLISANEGAETLTILTNDGTGRFVPASTNNVPGDYNVAAADLNGDGFVDLIVPNGNSVSGALSVLTNDGHGGFTLASTISVGSSPTFVAAADVNGDGFVDLISANEADDTLTVLTNDGLGGFVLSTNLPVGAFPHFVMAADVNGDGFLDLISANDSSGSLTILTNDGHGLFVAAATNSVGSEPSSIFAADINGDGKPDLISANEGDGTLSILTNAMSPAILPAGDGLSFNGSNNYVQVALASPPSTNYTISAWVYLRTGGSFNLQRAAVLGGESCGDSVEFMIRSETGDATDPQYLELGRCGEYNGVNSSLTVPLSMWTHVAVTVSSSNLVSYYVNGVAAGSWDGTGNDFTLGSTVNLGDNNAPGGRFFDGILDEVQIWTRALSQQEIQTNMNHNLVGNEPGLYAYYRFDEGTGTNTADAALHGGGSPGILQTWDASTNLPEWVPSGEELFTFPAVPLPPTQIEVLNGNTVLTAGQASAVNFDAVAIDGASPMASFIVSNTGGQTLVLGTFTPPAGYLTVTNLPESIPAGESALLTLQLAGTSVAGTFLGQVTISNNADTSFAFPIAARVLSHETVTLKIDPTNSGTASIGGTNGGGVFLQTTTQTVTATPAGGFEFIGWTGDASGTNNPLTVTVNSALNITANFASNGTAFTMIVSTTGFGAVTPDVHAKTYKKGQSFSLTAKPDAGNLFSNWTGSITSTRNPLTIKVASSLALQANFVTNPFLPVQGTFNGIFAPTNSGVTEATAGMLRGLTINSKGAYSGTVLIDGGSKPIHGVFSLDGQTTNVISRPASQGGPLTVTLAFTSGGAAPQVTGTVTGSDGLAPWVANLTADFATNVFPSAAYTMLLTPDTNNTPPAGSPGGDGYVVITNSAGAAKNPRSAGAKISGTLADGTAFSQAAPVSIDGFIPIYSSLYKNKGLLLGWINLTSTNAENVGLTWIRPAQKTPSYPFGFTNVLLTNQILLSRWTNSAATITGLTNLSLLETIDGASVSNFVLTNTAAGKVEGASANGTPVTGAINPKTGVWTLSIGKGAGKVVSSGAILQNSNSGGGFFLGKTNAQAALLTP